MSVPQASDLDNLRKESKYVIGVLITIWIITIGLFAIWSALPLYPPYGSPTLNSVMMNVQRLYVIACSVFIALSLAIAARLIRNWKRGKRLQDK